MKDDKQLDELFRLKLEGFELKPPGYVWDGILEKQAAERRKKRMLWFRLSGVAAALLLAFLLGLELQRSADRFIVNQPAVVDVNADQSNSGSGESKTDHLSATNDEEKKTENSSKNIVEVVTPRENKAWIVENSIQAESHEKPLASIRYTDDQGSEAMILLKSRTFHLSLAQPSVNELEALGQTNSGSLLTERDRKIIEQNMAALSPQKTNEQPHSWIVGAMVIPALAVNDIKYSEEYASNLSQSGNSSSLQMGGGLTLAYGTSARWSFQSGVMYNRLGQNTSNSSGRDNLAYSIAPSTDPDYFLVGKSVGGETIINGPAGQILLDQLPTDALVSSDFESVASSRDVLLTNSDFEQLFDYIEIPLMVRYQLVDRIIGLQLMAGVNAGFLVGNRAYVNSGQGRSSIGETSDMNSISYSSNFGVGIGYHLSPRLQLRFEPQLRYYLQSLSSNPGIDYKPYSFSFYTGINYTF